VDISTGYESGASLVFWFSKYGKLVGLETTPPSLPS
jgi:hypothetical protein